MRSYDDLLAWAQGKRVLDWEEASALQEFATAKPQGAEQALAAARALREALYAVVDDYLHARPANEKALAEIVQAFATAALASRLCPEATAFHWQPRPDPLHLERPLWPVARSAVQLLTEPQLTARVGQCADRHGCSYLFLDLSKNRSRRWCDINDCGNRAKQRRYYRRSQRDKEPGHSD